MTWACPEVQSPSEAMSHDAGPLRAEAACEVTQVAGPGIPHTLLTHPQPCTTTNTHHTATASCSLHCLWTSRLELCFARSQCKDHQVQFSGSSLMLIRCKSLHIMVDCCLLLGVADEMQESAHHGGLLLTAWHAVSVRRHVAQQNAYHHLSLSI